MTLARTKPSVRRRIINGMTWLDMADADAEFERWVHEGQIEPPEQGWRTWLMMAGRGFGKTRAGAEWIEKLARSRPNVRIALVGASIDEARRIMVEGVSGILTIAKRNKRKIKWEPSIGRLTWSNGSEAQLFSGDSPDGLRGPEHDFAWVLTFEVVADSAPVDASAILNEVTSGAIAAGPSTTIAGYAAYGASISAAVEPLVDVLAIELLDDGFALVSPPNAVTAPGDSELGCSAGPDRVGRAQRSQTPARDLPSSLSLTYHDPQRDYQSGLARASMHQLLGAGAGVELPAVLEAGRAKSLAESLIARRWAKRDKLTLRLPPNHLGLQPGSLIAPAFDQQNWIAEKVTVDSLVVIAELRPAYSSFESLPADPGRAMPSLGVVPAPTVVSVVELPDDGSGDADAPVVAVATSASSGSWRPVPLEIQIGTESFSISSSAVASIQGVAESVLPSGQAALIDAVNSVEVVLANGDDWIESVDDEALVSGANLAMLGLELIQFGEAVALGSNRFRLSRLLRGRRGTEWAMGAHQAGEKFVLVDARRLTRLEVNSAMAGAALRVTPRGLGDGDAAAVSSVVTGHAMRPPSPAHLRASLRAGGLHCSWVRRSSRGWAWLDGVDAPLGSFTERYRVSLRGSGGIREVETSATSLEIAPTELADLGGPEVRVSVVQVGDYGVSQPAELTIVID